MDMVAGQFGDDGPAKQSRPAGSTRHGTERRVNLAGPRRLPCNARRSRMQIGQPGVRERGSALALRMWPPRVHAGYCVFVFCFSPVSNQALVAHAAPLHDLPKRESFCTQHKTKQNSVRPPKLLASCRSFHRRCTAAVRKREGIPTATARWRTECAWHRLPMCRVYL